MTHYSVLTTAERDLILDIRPNYQVYSYDTGTAKSLVRKGYLQEFWTWASGTRPGVGLTEQGVMLRMELMRVSDD